MRQVDIDKTDSQETNFNICNSSKQPIIQIENTLKLTEKLGPFSCSSTSVENKLSLLHQNIRGLRGKLNELLICIEELEISKPVDIICLSEHHVTTGIDMLNVTGFKLASYFCRENMERGGVATFVRNCFDFKNIDITKFCSEQHFEACATEVVFYNKSFIIVSIYRAPSGNFNLFIKNLEALLSHLTFKNKEIVIAGDFNVDILKSSISEQLLQSVTLSFNLIPTVNFATRVCKSSETAIDNIFVDKSREKNYITKPIVNGLSDHDMQHLMLNVETCKDSKSIKSEYRRVINQSKIENFRRLLKYMNWTDVYNTSDINGQYKSFINIVTSTFENCFPLTVTQIKQKCKNKPWITQGIKISCGTKRELYLLSRTSSDVSIVAHYKEYCKILKKVIQKSKQQYYEEQIITSGNKIKTIWDIVKTETGGARKEEEQISLKINDTLVTSACNVANLLNKYFVSVTDNMGLTGSVNSAMEFLRPVSANYFSKMEITLTSPKEIASIIKSLKSKNSSGYDNISTKLIKECSHEFSFILSYLCNQSLISGTFPDWLKYAEVKPLYKKGDKEVPSNYRPISLLPAFSKIFEKVMFKRLLKQLTANDVLSKSQFGFIKGSDIEKAIYTYSENVLNSLDNKLETTGIFCDLSKAFDCVKHSILLSKLEYYGVSGSSAKWFESYLTNRKQRVLLQNTRGEKYQSSSDWEVITCGVPQGSILGPLLFLVYINDLSSVTLPDAKFVLFADDTNIAISSKSNLDVEIAANQIFCDINKWFVANSLSLNFEKTHYMQFRTCKRFPSSICITYEDMQIEEVDSVKFLGLQLDHKFSWEGHTTELLKSLNKSIFAMRMMSDIGDIKIKKLAYFAYFHSIMSYGIIFWGNSSNQPKVFRVQKRVIRLICGVNSRTSCRNLFKELGILTTASQYIYSLMKFVANNESLFPTNSSVHNINTRSKNNLHKDLKSLTLVQKGVQNSGTNIFNKLPATIKNLVSNKVQFKQSLKDFLVGNSFYSINEFLNRDS